MTKNQLPMLPKSFFVAVGIFLALIALPNWTYAQTQIPEDPEELGKAIEKTVTDVQNKLEEVSDTDGGSDQTLEEIRKRIEKTVEEKSSQVMGVMSELALERKAIIGEVERVTTETLTVVNKDGRLILPITPEMSFIKDEETIEYSEVAVGNWVSVLGMTDEKGDLTPRFVEVYTETLNPEPQIVLLGSIESIDARTITVVSRYGQTIRSFDITRNSEFQDSDGETADADDFITDMNVLLIGTEETDEDETTSILKTVRALAPLDEQASSND